MGKQGEVFLYLFGAVVVNFLWVCAETGRKSVNMVNMRLILQLNASSW